jgi:hypothetical protein
VLDYRKASLCRIVLAGFAVALSVGCAETRRLTGADLPDPGSSELRPIQFSDVPVPYGFDLQTSRNQSLTFESAGVRVGRLLYKGSSPTSKVASFFRAQMARPPYGWLSVGETLEGSKTILKFQKRNSRSTITIYPVDIYTLVQVEVEPQDEA